jgi:hypothetical protein
MIAKSLMAASAGILLVLGAIHLVYTFSGPQLKPRDQALQIAMTQISPVLTRETTMWKVWVGINASHSMGAILFGLIYGYLALAHSEIVFRSHFLLLVGLAMVGGLLVLGKVYWFSVPFWSTCVAFACYAASVVASRA